MRYLTSDTNLVADATLTATNIVASQAFEQTARNADGGGIVSLTGAYTSSDDAVYDLEVTSTTINGAPQISAPVFAGVGNGTISGIGATFEGIHRKHMLVRGGENRDSAWYAVTDDEWPNRRAALVAWLAPTNFDAAGAQRASLRREPVTRR